MSLYEFFIQTFLVENENESWRQYLVNDNISGSQSPFHLLSHLSPHQVQ